MSGTRERLSAVPDMPYLRKRVLLYDYSCIIAEKEKCNVRFG